MRGRAVGVLVALAVALAVAAACGGGDDGAELAADSTSTSSAEETTSTSAAPSTTGSTTPSTTAPPASPEGRWDPLPAPLPVEEIPPLLLSSGDRILVVDGGVARELVSLDGHVGAALGDPDRTIVAELAEETAGGRWRGVELVRVTGGRADVEVAREDDRSVSLFDLVGSDQVLYSYRVDRDGEEPHGQVVLRGPGAEERDIVNSAAPEFGTAHASVGGGLILTSSYSDLTESMALFTIEGEPVAGRPLPTTDLPYNMPPLVVSGELSPDGTELAWLEGPDWDGGKQVTVGEWVLVVASDGRERLRLRVAGLDGSVVRLEYDGRFALLSAEDPDGALLLPLVVDTRSDPPRAAVLDEPGIVTFVSPGFGG